MSSRIPIISVKKEIIFEVSDNGIGVPEYQLTSLFRQFFRADNVRQKNIEGTGLGLYIAKLVVVAHGGKIWCESKKEKGIPDVEVY